MTDKCNQSVRGDRYNLTGGAYESQENPGQVTMKRSLDENRVDYWNLGRKAAEERGRRLVSLNQRASMMRLDYN